MYAAGQSETAYTTRARYIEERLGILSRGVVVVVVVVVVVFYVEVCVWGSYARCSSSVHAGLILVVTRAVP